LGVLFLKQAVLTVLGKKDLAILEDFPSQDAILQSTKTSLFKVQHFMEPT
jgi:hypothetical protein